MIPRRRILPIFVPHLGCPNDCVFCNQRKISGSLFPASAGQVAGALAAAEVWSPPVELAFYGGSFTAIPQEAQRALLAAVQPFRERGFVASIRVSTRPDAISPEGLGLLRDYGVETVELGAQSMDDRVLALSGRGHRAEDTVAASRLVRAGGFRLILQMMTGLPGADRAADLATARALCELRPDGVRVYPTVILRDTALEALWRQGAYRAHTVLDAVETCAPIVEVFRQAGIPILRLGLNPTEALSGGEAVGGAYHPALGELVYSRLYLDQARALLRARRQDFREVTLVVPPREISRMTGRKKANLLALQAEFGLRSIRVKGGTEQQVTVAIEAVL